VALAPVEMVQVASEWTLGSAVASVQVAVIVVMTGQFAMAAG